MLRFLLAGCVVTYEGRAFTYYGGPGGRLQRARGEVGGARPAAIIRLTLRELA